MVSCRSHPEKESCTSLDADGDGFTLEDGDCNDLNPAIYPNAEDVCDGLDNDCDGFTDDGENCALYTADANIHFFSDPDQPMGSGGVLGDITGDGELDMVANSFLVGEGFVGESKVHIFAGPFSEQQSTADSQLQLELGDLDRGSVHNMFTDFNGDGQVDLLVASAANSQGGDQAGAVYLLLGPIVENQDLEDEYSMLWIGSEGDWAGHSIADLGDVNGDGRSDILIGAYEYNTDVVEGGAAYILFGQEEVSGDMAMLSNSDVVLIGDEDENLGYEVSAAGDLNGDGFRDLAINAYRYDTANRNAGRTFVFFGPIDESLTMSQADLYIDGYEEIGQQGSTLASLPDIDGDGNDDLLVSSQYGDASLSSQMTGDHGTAYIVTGIQNEDIVLSDVNNKIVGVQTEENFGREGKGLGDLNGDGFGEVLITSKRFGMDFVEQGRMSLFYGPIEGSYTSSQADTLIYGSNEEAWAGLSLDLYGQGEQGQLLIGSRQISDGVIYGESHLFVLQDF